MMITDVVEFMIPLIASGLAIFAAALKTFFLKSKKESARGEKVTIEFPNGAKIVIDGAGSSTEKMASYILQLRDDAWLKEAPTGTQEFPAEKPKT